MGGQTGALITLVYACNPVQPLASVAVIVDVNMPAVVGVPEMVPLMVSDIPGASSPAVMLKVYGACPPLAVMILLYATPSVPFGRGGGERVMGGQAGSLITLVYACNPVQPLASVAVTVKVNVPATLGVPDMSPLLESDIPGASSPAVTMKIYGACPPLAVMVLL